MMLLTAVSMIWDLILGEPKRLYERIQHPVSWMSELLMFFEKRLNRKQVSAPRQKIYGSIALLFCICVCGTLALLVQISIQQVFYNTPLVSLMALSLVASVFIAAHSLFAHVFSVKDALATEDLQMARGAVGLIVGRNTDTLDEIGVARAATESLAENFSDGVISPIFWLLLGGLPGIVIFKMVNTADSMVGHKTERFENFGWASAKLDDVLNYVPARLTALLIVLSGVCLRAQTPLLSLHIARRDSRLHASPNAGWPEAAMAGVLGVRLGGPRQYAGVATKDFAWLGPEFPKDKKPDLGRALNLAQLSCGLVLGGLVIGGLA